MQRRKTPLPALAVKLSKYNVDDVDLGVCKTGAEEARVTEVRTSLSEKKFELWREIKVCNMIKLLSRKPTSLRLVSPSAAKIKVFTASALYPHTQSFITKSSLNREWTTDCDKRSH